MNPFALTNKKVLITGASSGIGRATAIICAEMGAEVYLTGRNAAALNETYSKLKSANHKIIIADLNNQEAIDELVKDLPLLNGVVFNAGINHRMLTQYIKNQQLEAIINTNLVSPVMLTKALLKAKKITEAASLVYMSSIAVHHSSIGDGIYSATKGGLSSFTKVLAMELAPKKIRVNTIQPGMVKTKLIENGPLTEEEYSKDEERYPLGRYGNPEEVAYAAVYLMSDATKWMTGSDVKLDGGISLI